MTPGNYSEPHFSAPQRRQKLFHWAIALTPLLGSAALNLGLHIPGLGCPLMRYVGVPCPAWGLTRSFMALARGDWAAAIAFHAFGPILALGFLVAAIHIAWELWRNRPLRMFYRPMVTNPRYQVFGFLILLGYHGVRLQTLWQSGDLDLSLQQAPLGDWLLKSAEWLTRLT